MKFYNYLPFKIANFKKLCLSQFSCTTLDRKPRMCTIKQYIDKEKKQQLKYVFLQEPHHDQGIPYTR